MNTKNNLKLLIKLLKDIKSKRDNTFDGLGLIVYTNYSSLPVVSFTNENSLNLPIKDFKKIVDLLLNISKTSHELHDGFHLISDEFQLTHLSNYFSTPIVDTGKIENKYGSRYRTALYGSFLPDVLFTAVLSKNYGPIIFSKGESISLELEA